MELVTTAFDIVKEAGLALEAGDVHRFRELVAEDCRYLDSTAFPYTAEFTKREAAMDFLFTMRRAYPDMQIQRTDTLSVGDTVVLQGILTGTHLHETVLPGVIIPASGKQISLPICQVFTVRDGKIVRGASYYDSATAMIEEGLNAHSAETPI